MPGPTGSPHNNPYRAQADQSARHYQRDRHLPALLALWPSQLEDFGLKATRDIICQLEANLQAERRRGRSAHWCYDLNRHLALISALKGEQKHLSDLRRKTVSGTQP